MNFTDLVTAAKREAKGEASPEEIAALNDPANAGRWVEALRSAIDDAEHQFAQQQDRLNRARADAAADLISRDQYAELVASYEAWTKKASRYRIGLQQRLAELSAADGLSAAIAEHRRITIEFGMPSPADEALWRNIPDLA